MDFVKSIRHFNEIAGTTEKYDPRKLALYIGLILEETAEMIESVGFETKENNKMPLDISLATLHGMLDTYSKRFKVGEFDKKVSTNNRVATLDAAVDIAVVALGAGISNGADILGACNNVAESNLSKFPMRDGKRVVLKDKNGKVKKPPEYKPPELQQFLKG